MRRFILQLEPKPQYDVHWVSYVRHSLTDDRIIPSIVTMCGKQSDLFDCSITFEDSTCADCRSRRGYGS